MEEIIIDINNYVEGIDFHVITTTALDGTKPKIIGFFLTDQTFANIYAFSSTTMNQDLGLQKFPINRNNTIE